MKRKSLSFRQRKARYGVLFLAPWLFGFLFLFAVPLIKSLNFSFGELIIQAKGAYTVNFVGFRNYIFALTEHADFNRLLTESVLDMLINVPLILIFSLFAATLLNQKFHGRAIARAIFFLPVILASGIIAILSSQSIISSLMNGMTYGTTNTALDSEVTGLATNVLQSFELRTLLREAGVSAVIVNYLTDAVNRIYEIISSAGVQILIFLAGLQSISPSIYEAAKIEGATGYECFWKVTFPMVSPLILTNVIYTIIDSFSNNHVTQLAYSTAFSTLDFGLSAAMSWMYFLVIAIFLIIVSLFLSKRVFYYD